MDGTVAAELDLVLKSLREKVGELVGAHFSGGHIKFFVLDCAFTADITVNPNILGRIGEDHICELPIH